MLTPRVSASHNRIDFNTAQVQVRPPKRILFHSTAKPQRKQKNLRNSELDKHFEIGLLSSFGSVPFEGVSLIVHHQGRKFHIALD